MKFTPELTPERKAQIKANRWAHRQLRKCPCLDCERARAILEEEEKRKIQREKAKRLAKEIERYGCTEEEHLKKVRKEREKEDEIVEAGFKAPGQKTSSRSRRNR